MKKLSTIWLLLVALLAFSWGTYAYNTIGIVGPAANGEWPHAGNPTPDIELVRDPDNQHGWWLLNQPLTVGQMKFRANKQWTTSWGNNMTTCGTSNGGDINITVAGNYDLYINTNTGYFCIKLVSTRYGSGAISIIGAAFAGWGTDVQLNQDPANPHKWSLYYTGATTNDAKFRTTGSWATNWGATSFPSGQGTQGGPNIPVTAGNYLIRFNSISGEYRFSGPSPYTTIGIIGSALPNGFAGPDTDLTPLHTGSRVWKITNLVLGEGEVKFRANDAWTTNWGASSFPTGFGTQGGANIPVAPGKYTITFNDETGYYHFQGDYITITAPAYTDLFPQSGNTITFSANVTSVASTFRVLVNGIEVQSANTTNTITYNRTATINETITVKFEATIGSETVSRERVYKITIRGNTVNQPRPTWVKQGPNYHAGDPTKVTLVLLAPGKDYVYAMGDFNNWTPSDAYLMKKDGEYWWITLSGLNPGQEYVYQYWMNENVKVGDPYADKVADPWNDPWIPSYTYPSLPTYTQTAWGRATVFQTNQTPYTWTHPTVAGGKPHKNDLIIYELHLRDFFNENWLAANNKSRYKAVIDFIPYFQQLGINAIHFMPFSEFEGNDSWGYDPNYYFAPDKYYGTKNDLKDMINALHAAGIAVIQDVVLNHSFNSSPMAMMYWNHALNRPAANNPWYNEVAPNPCFSWGSDFKQTSTYTQNFIDDVLKYWVTEYKIDGFRFDFTKGFSQYDDGNCGSNYSAQRIGLLKRMADALWSVDPTAYVILEHFAVSSEEDELTDYGMMVWGNMNHQYRETVKGYPGNGSFGALDSYSGDNGGRGWGNRNLVGYMESHDENRVGYDAKAFGRVVGSYDITELENRLQRTKAAMALFLLVPGPKMIWQFGELGYDYSIDYCTNGTIDLSGACRTGRKPTPWDDGIDVDGNNVNDVNNPERQKLRKVIAALNKLRKEKSGAFAFGSFTWQPSGDFRRILLTHADMHMLVLANFNVAGMSGTAGFSKTGNWYDFFNNGAVKNVTNVNEMIYLKPGEFRVYIDRNDGTYTLPEPNLMTLPSFTANNVNMYVTGDFITEGCGPWCYRREMTLVADHLWEIAEFDYVAGGQFKFVNALTWGDCTPGNPYDWGDNTPGAYSGTADQCSMNNIVFHNLPSGKYNLQFNDQTLFYRISTVSNREMYISGTFNGWAPMTMTLAGEDTWIVNVNISSGDQFKFRNTTDWSDRNYGAKEPTPTPAPYDFSGYADNLQNSLTNNNVVPAGMLSNLNKVRFNDKTYFYEIMLRVAETPTDLEITNVVPMTTIVNANHIDLSWTYNNNYYAGYKIASGVFEIFRSVDGGAFVKIGETPNITTTTYSDTSVSRGHTYSYRVRVKATALDP